MSLIKNNISLLPLLGDVISRTIKEQVEIPSETLEKMEVNVGPDFKGTMTYCSFLEYWKNRYDKRYTKNKGSGYTQPVKDAFEKHKTSKITLRIMNTVSSLENGGKETGDNGRCYGLFQFCREYWSDYGITSQTDAETADIATRQFVKHATILGERISNNLGLDVFSPENQWLLYLCWQQGLGGTLKIYNSCEDVESFKGDKVLDTTPDIIGPTTADDIMLGKAILKKGDQSDLVKFIQIMLLKDFQIDLGDSGEFGDGVDGAFLDGTHDAVENFQEKFGLAVDGVVGKCTLETIIKGKAPKCCKSGACKEDRCKDSGWCSKIKADKKKIKKKRSKDSKNKESEVDVDNVTPSKGLPGNFAEIPGGQGNFRSEQPSLKEFAKLFEDYPDIERVVRMNGNKDSGGLSMEDEKKYVESTGREYIWFNAHNPWSSKNSYTLHYTPGYTGAVKLGLDELNQGNTFIHCTHGADRTGFVVAAYIKERLGWDNERLWEYTVGFNSWDGGYEGCCTNAHRSGKLICNGTAFAYYLASFYPIPEWCKAKEERMSCKVCKNLPDEFE